MALQAFLLRFRRSIDALGAARSGCAGRFGQYGGAPDLELVLRDLSKRAQTSELREDVSVVRWRRRRSGREMESLESVERLRGCSGGLGSGPLESLDRVRRRIRGCSSVRRSFVDCSRDGSGTPALELQSRDLSRDAQPAKFLEDVAVFRRGRCNRGLGTVQPDADDRSRQRSGAPALELVSRDLSCDTQPAEVREDVHVP